MVSPVLYDGIDEQADNPETEQGSHNSLPLTIYKEIIAGKDSQQC